MTDGSQKKWMFFLLIGALSLSLRLLHLNQGFWMDEIITITEFARKGWLSIITEVPVPNNHIFYTLLAKLFITILGEREWSARIPAFIMGALTPPVLYLIARRYFSEMVSVSAGLFAALNFWLIWFSQDARGYSGLILFGLLSNYFFSQVLEVGKLKFKIYYLVSSALAIGFHLDGFFLLFGQGLWLMILLFQKKTVLKNLWFVILAMLLSLAVYVPSASQLFHYAFEQGQEVGTRGVNLRLFQESLMMLAGTKNFTLALLSGSLFLVGSVFAFQKISGFWLINFFAMVLIVAFSALGHFFIYPRFLSFLFPWFLLSLALALGSLGNLIGKRSATAFGYVFTALVCWSLIPGLLNYYRLGKQGLKDASEYLAQNHPAKTVIAYGIIAEPFRYYFPNAIPVAKNQRLSPEFIKSKLILSLRSEWDPINANLVKAYCQPEKFWLSAGYRENILVLINCPKER